MFPYWEYFFPYLPSLALPFPDPLYFGYLSTFFIKNFLIPLVIFINFWTTGKICFFLFSSLALLFPSLLHLDSSHHISKHLLALLLFPPLFPAWFLYFSCLYFHASLNIFNCTAHPTVILPLFYGLWWCNKERNWFKGNLDLVQVDAVVVSSVTFPLSRSEA